MTSIDLARIFRDLLRKRPFALSLANHRLSPNGCLDPIMVSLSNHRLNPNGGGRDWRQTNPGRIYRLFFLILSFALLCSSCHSGANDEGDSEAAIDPIASVRTTKVQSQIQSRSISATGDVRFAPEFVHTVDSAMEVRVESVLVSPGESIRAGQVLLTVKPTANSALEIQRARFDQVFAQREWLRLNTLKTQQLATNAELAAATQARDNAAATLRSLQSKTAASGGEIKASKAGFVASVEVQQGDVVAPGAPLLHLTEASGLQARLAIDPAALDALQEGGSVQLQAAYDESVVATGLIHKLVRQIDPTTRMAQVLVDVAAGSALLPGADVKATLTNAAPKAGLFISRNAVLYADERTYVFVLEQYKAKQVEVEVGSEVGDTLEILQGLKVGDEVVIEGNYELVEGMAVNLGAQTK
jgi:membrane fusion protein, multidrug efflux system